MNSDLCKSVKDETAKLLLSLSGFIEAFASMSVTLTSDDEKLLSSSVDLLSSLLKHSQQNRWTIANKKGLIHLMKLTKKVSGPLNTKIWTCISILLGDRCKKEEDSLKESLGKFSDQISPNVLADILRSVKKSKGPSRYPNKTAVYAHLSVETIFNDSDRPSEDLSLLEKLVIEEKEEDVVYLRGNIIDAGKHSGSDITHEFRPNDRITNVSKITIAKIATSMLNSGKGGCIYFGIAENGKIEGIHCTRHMRNEFRISIDGNLTQSIQPMISHDMYYVRFSPVVLKKKDLQTPLAADHNLYVITITLKPRLGLYFLNDNSCYCRIGDQTKMASCQLVREKAALIEKETCLAEIDRLKKEISSYERAFLSNGAEVKNTHMNHLD